VDVFGAFLQAIRLPTGPEVEDRPKGMTARRSRRPTLRTHAGLEARHLPVRRQREESTMASATDMPVDLYVAAYDDPNAARGDWDMIKELAKDDTIKVDGLVLVSRHTDGKIHVDDDFHETRKGAVWGAVGGAVVGIIFPPSLLASAAVGAGIGAGAGALKSHGQKKDIKADVEQTLPLNSSGIVAIFEEQWEEDVDDALSHASNVTKEKVDKDSANKVKAAASKNA
jgi:uncharacterized membrane protein